MFKLQNREKREAPMRSSLNLCDSLHVRPTEAQHKLLERFDLAIHGLEATRLPGFKILEVSKEDTSLVERAMAMAMIWRLLDVPGSEGIILAPNQSRRVDFMTFLEAVTQRCNDEFAQITKITRWNVLQFGGVSTWELRVMPNNAGFVREKAPNSIISLILDAGDTTPAFVEACQALEKHCTHPKHLLIRVW